MKTKLYVLVAGFILLSTTTQAQKFGLRAGINLSNEKASAAGVSVRASSKVGFTVGAFADWEITNAFSIQSELNYSQMGAKVGSQKETLDYIAIPVLAKFRLGELGIYAGPQASFLVGGRDKFEGQTIGVASQFKMLDLSAVGGAEYVFAKKLVVSARYQLGLTNISDMGVAAKLINKGASFTLGYKF
jgi:hypothetical protein